MRHLRAYLQRPVRHLHSGLSLQLRQVSAAGCNACEADLNVLATPFFDLARFGINFVASPRHADGIVVTGPISRNMKTALLQTYEATPEPRVVIAVGSCTLTGGPFRGSSEVSEGLDTLLPVDLFIPGCPPHPMTNWHALLNFFETVWQPWRHLQPHHPKYQTLICFYSRTLKGLLTLAGKP